MKSKIPLIIGVIITAVAIFMIIILTSGTGPTSEVLPTYDSNQKLSQTIDVSSIKLSSQLTGSEANGNIADHTKGNPDAPVILYEYADFQCSGCATVNPWMEKILEKYKNKVAIVFRSSPLNIHPNAAAASVAAEAAGLQGYWEEYGDLLFANQSEWFYDKSDSQLINHFVSYFRSVAGDSADLKQFKKDAYSDRVKQKVAFDTALSNRANVDGTPSFFDSKGNMIDWYDANTESKFFEFFENYIETELAKQEK